MSAHRFIGGPHDGEWHDVRRDAGLFLPPIWTIAERPEVRFPSDPVNLQEVRHHTDYVPLPLHVGENEVVTLFIERGTTPEEALLRLVAGYRTTLQREVVK